MTCERARSSIRLSRKRAPDVIAVSSHARIHAERTIDASARLTSSNAYDVSFYSCMDALESPGVSVHSPAMRASVVGLTGGIACGKSAASRIFASLGVPIVDADVVARVVVEPGSSGLRALVEAFGRGILTLTGALDREKLGELVFADPAKRAMLNGILHPLIAAESMRQIAAESAKPVPYVIYDAALLIENGLQRAFPELVVVSTPYELQKQRLMARDGFSPEAAEQRIAAQIPLADKEKLATLVIHNDADLATLEERVRAAHEVLLERLKAKSAD